MITITTSYRQKAEDSKEQPDWKVWKIDPSTNLRFHNRILQQQVFVEYYSESGVWQYGGVVHHITKSFWWNIEEVFDDN